MPIRVPAPVPSGAGALARIRRFETRIKVRGEDTAGRYSVLEHALDAGCVAMPMHRHLVVTKTLYALQGTLSVQYEQEVIRLDPGACLVVPAGAMHTFWNARAPERGEDAAASRAAFLTVAAPGGLEQYYQAIATLLDGHDRPDIDAVLAASAAHGIEVDLDSLLDLVEQQRVSLA